MEGTDPISMRTLQPGTRLGRYRIVERVGLGGMAELYLAVADGISRFEKLVVLKLVHAHLAADPKLSAMLLKEARIAATLDHPNVAQVIDVGSDNGEHYLAMEYVHGKDVGAILRALPNGEAMPLPCALEIVRSACQGLHYAHTKLDLAGQPLGIVHRDVTPSNVLVAYAGGVKLVDFGIAKVTGHGSTTQTGVLKGKFGYMSPEQSSGAALDCRSDVFALGILLYELLTARRAFVGHNAFAVMNKVMAGDYVHPCRVRPELPPELGEIVTRAMAVDPDARHPSAAAMQKDIEDFAHDWRLRLGAPVLAAFMRAHFGEPTAPVVADLPDVARPRSDALDGTRTTIDVVTSELRRRRRSWTTATALAVVAIGAGLAGWRVGADDRAANMVEVAVPTSVSATPSVAAPAPAPATVPAAAQEPVVAEASEPRAAPIVERNASATERRRARKTKRRAPADRPREADPAARLDAMLPPSMQP